MQAILQRIVLSFFLENNYAWRILRPWPPDKPATNLPTYWMSLPNERTWAFQMYIVQDLSIFQIPLPQIPTNLANMSALCCWGLKRTPYLVITRIISSIWTHHCWPHRLTCVTTPHRPRFLCIGDITAFALTVSSFGCSKPGWPYVPTVFNKVVGLQFFASCSGPPWIGSLSPVLSLIFILDFGVLAEASSSNSLCKLPKRPVWCSLEFSIG